MSLARSLSSLSPDPLMYLQAAAASHHCVIVAEVTGPLSFQDGEPDQMMCREAGEGGRGRNLRPPSV